MIEGRVFLLGSAFVMASCGTPPARPTTLSAPPAPSATPSVSVSAGEPSTPLSNFVAADAPRDAPPFVQSAEQREDFRTLSMLCEPAAVEQRGTVSIGCTCCGPFSDCRPEKRPVTEANPDSFYAASSFAYGSFTAPGKDEVAISIDGCESHADNYGGLLIGQKTPHGFELVRYESGTHPNKLKRYRLKDGHDILVAEWIDVHMSTAQRIMTVDLGAEPEGPKTDILFELLWNLTSACTGLPPGELAHDDSIDAWTFEDENGDGILDLSIRAHTYTSSMTPAFMQRCQKMLATFDDDEARPVDFHDVMKRKALDVRFLSDGMRFYSPEDWAKQRKRKK
jgi:hypothetical protein